MNAKLRSLAVNSTLEGLAMLPEDWQNRFKKMYGCKLDKRGYPTLTPEQIIARTIEEIISEIPDDRIDWAMQQVLRSVEKFTKSAASHS